MKKSLGQAFHGWFFPYKQPADPFYHHAHGTRQWGMMGPLSGYLRSAYVMTTPQPAPQLYEESFVYVGCVHGGNDQLYHRLESLSHHRPDYIIFAGDLTGSAEMEQLKQTFYEEKLLHPTGRFASFDYFGHWAASWPKEEREKLLATVEPAARKLVTILKMLRRKKVPMVLLEGNWDNPTTSGLRHIAQDDIRPVFDAHQFFSAQGFHFISDLHLLETETTLHLLLPYRVLLHFSFITNSKLRQIRRRVWQARGKGKSVIVVGHAEANWQMHHLQHTGAQPQGERETVIKNFGRAIALFAPDEVIYPHQHRRLRDGDGKLMDLNAKYLLQIVRPQDQQIQSPYVRLVDRLGEKPPTAAVVATYIPMGYTAQETFLTAYPS